MKKLRFNSLIPIGDLMKKERTMRAILIDPVAKTVVENDFDIIRDDVKSLYRILGCDHVDRAGPLPNGDMVYVDGYGLIRTNPGPYFIIKGWADPLAGKGLLLGETRGGRLASPRTSLLEARHAVAFPDLELVGFEPIEEIVRIPGMEGGVMVIGSQAVFRRKQ